MATNWTEDYVELMGGRVHLLKGGQGSPLVILMRDNGHPGKQEFFDLLAEKHTVYVPTHPGYADSDPESWEWLVNFRDLAIAQKQVLGVLGLDGVSVVGLGYGGWMAAEIATMSNTSFKNMILVGAMGIQPQNDYIYDQFLVNTETYMRNMFHDQAKFEAVYTKEPEFSWLERWETDREMTSRIGWKPYMYHRALPKLLTAINIPTLIAWGREDKVVPLECADLYKNALPNSKVVIYDQCGHAVDMERPRELAKAILDFAG